jgi:archaemetzincin
MKYLSILTILIFCYCKQIEKKPIVKNTISNANPIKILDTIHIIPLGKVEQVVVDDVVKGLTAFYHKTVIVQKVEPLDKRLLAESKKRYSADSILKRFKSPQNTVVITSVDIVTPKTKVTNEWGIFGLGLRPGKVCVISSFRLKKNATAKLLADRLQKVAIHEVGHNLGLNHCTKDPECLMNDAGGTIKQVDQEKFMFCENCKKLIGMK